MVQAIVTKEELRKQISILHVKQFAIMKEVEEYARGSSWRVDKSLSNIKSDLYFNVSDIECIVYNQSQDYTFLVLNNVIKRGISEFQAVRFSTYYSSIKVDFCEYFSEIESPFFHFEDITSDIVCNVSTEPIYKALCKLSEINTPYAFITLEGSLYPSTFLCNNVTELEMRSLRRIDC